MFHLQRKAWQTSLRLSAPHLLCFSKIKYPSGIVVFCVMLCECLIEGAIPICCYVKWMTDQESLITYFELTTILTLFFFFQIWSLTTYHLFLLVLNTFHLCGLPHSIFQQQNFWKRPCQISATTALEMTEVKK